MPALARRRRHPASTAVDTDGGSDTLQLRGRGDQKVVLDLSGRDRQASFQNTPIYLDGTFENAIGTML